MSQDLPGIAADEFARVTPRQWWLFFELSEPKSIAALTLASGVTEATVRSHLSAMIKRSVVRREAGVSADRAIYVRSIALTHEQEIAARGKVASRSLVGPRRVSEEDIAEWEMSKSKAKALKASKALSATQQYVTATPDIAEVASESKETPSGYRSPAAEMASKFLVWTTLVAGVTLGIVMAVSSSAGAFWAILAFFSGLVIGSLVFGIVVWLPIELMLESDESRRRQKAITASAAVKSAEVDAWVPLRKWRGITHKTREPLVRARCTRCHPQWSIEGKDANTIADAQGLGNRMIRGGTRTEQFGASLTLGASGRRTAAGLESERMQRELSTTLNLGCCPGCGRVDAVQLRR